MKVLSVLLLVASAAAGAIATPSSADLNVDAAAPSVQEEMEKHSPLDATMGVLKKGQRALRGQIKDPKANKAALLENLKGMEAAAHASIVMMPGAAAAVPKAELDAWVVAYKQKMTMLLVNILAMEDAAMRESAEDLATAYKAISDTKKTGHENFRDQ